MLRLGVRKRKRMKSLRNRIVGSAVAAAAALAWVAPTWAQCPAQGSGAAGVAQWTADNCPPGGTGCANPATTCNGEFTIELLSVTQLGDFVTFEYEVCQIAGQAALSHWSFGLGGIDCLGDGFTLADLIVDATLNGAATAYVIGLDPTTQLFSLKFDEGVAGGTCNIFTVTFDTAALAPGFTIGVGCVTAATKAGNQDIQRADRASPGYACIAGPVCEEEVVETCWEDETAWAAGRRYTSRGNWATYTAYVPDSEVTLYAGQTHDAGTVYFSPPDNGWVMIIITLNEGWRFFDDPQNVKIQDYATAPSGNPAPGGFAHKGEGTGSVFMIVVPENNFYGVHVDVEREVPCE